MINFSNFKSNSQSNNNFVETVSLEEMKAACNNAIIEVSPSKEKTHKSGILFFLILIFLNFYYSYISVV